MKNFVVLLMMLMSLNMPGQVCNGSLGENIFEDGDFGSGNQTNLVADPDIAPGYTYVTQGPPSDGFYILTNNTGSWNNLWDSWLRIRDNSNDPNGYMMVVNASYEPGAFYDQVVNGLCPNTLYEFSADMINMIKIGVANHSDPNVSFLIDEEERYTTGNIPKTESWQTYGFTFITGPDQTEVRLTLRNNAPGGIGNDLALDNIAFRPCGPTSFIEIDSEETIFLCEEDDPLTISADIAGGEDQTYSIQWQQSLDNGETWQDVGAMNQEEIVHEVFIPNTYNYRYISASTDENLLNTRCRIFSDIITIVVVPKTSEVRDSFCTGSEFVFGDNAIMSGGNYIDTFISSLNCDSIVFLELIELEDPMISLITEISDPSCFGYEDGAINIESIENGFPPYTIMINGEATNFENVGLIEGGYTIEVEDRYGCYLNEEYILTEPELFIIETIEDQEVLLGESVMVSTTGNYDIVRAEWNTTAGLSCTVCPDPEILPIQDGVYEITAFNQEGCSSSASFRISVNKSNILFMPNIFSPNGDGVNDDFILTGFRNSIRLVEKFVVADRWGNIVHKRENMEVTDPDLYWSPNRSVAEGVYTYYISADLIDDTTEQFTGEVTVLK